jgi:two-component system, NarL family, nitrate/nitrite response regulator NarL
MGSGLTMRDIRVLITDDHSLFRESLSRFLRTTEGFRVVGECTDVNETIAACNGTDADIVLLDYDLGEEQGLRLLSELKDRRKPTKVLIVTAGMPDAATQFAMEAGASGVFLKHNNLEKLLSAIQRVADGEIWLDDTVLRGLVASRNPQGEIVEQRRPLTARQSEVMRGILDGLTNKEIALRMNCSESSVKAVIQELFHKAGVRTRSQLVRVAIEKHASDWLLPKGDLAG